MTSSCLRANDSAVRVAGRRANWVVPRQWILRLQLGLLRMFETEVMGFALGVFNINGVERRASECGIARLHVATSDHCFAHHSQAWSCRVLALFLFPPNTDMFFI